MHAPGHFYYLEQTLLQERRELVKEALRAFRKNVIRGKIVYTCNVARLYDMERLGPNKNVPIWNTHFFLQSTHFHDAYAVVFSRRPGLELADFSRKMVDTIYLLLRDTELVEPKTGRHITLETPLEFASME